MNTTYVNCPYCGCDTLAWEFDTCVECGNSGLDIYPEFPNGIGLYGQALLAYCKRTGETIEQARRHDTDWIGEA